MARYDNDPHCLYRLWDKGGRLLYVGCSCSPLRRFKAHESYQIWASLIASATMEWFQTRAEAIAAETAAIQNEAPEWNIHRKPNDKKHTLGKRFPGVDRSDPQTWVRKLKGGA